eukprot:scaffold18301_cov79-Skeletonema_menzelii.AAC.1
MAVQVVNKDTAAISAQAVTPSSSSSTSMLHQNHKESLPLLLRIILTDPDQDNNNNNNNLRDLSLTKAVATLSTPQLLTQLSLLDEFRRSPTNNLYQRVRALFFLYAVHRFHLPERRRLLEDKQKKKKRRKCRGVKNDDDEKFEQQQQQENIGSNTKNENEMNDATFICPKGYAALVDRRFDEAIDHFLEWVLSSSSTMKLCADEEEDCLVYDPIEKGEGTQRLYPVPRTTSLISNLTFSRDGPLPITTATVADSSSVDTKSSTSLFSRGYSSSIASFVSEETTLPTATKQQQQQQVHSSTQQLQQQQQPLLLLLPSEATSSALAKSYRSLAFQTLADQVKRSVRSHDGNEWMFNVANVGDTPLVWSEDLLLQGIGNEEEDEERRDFPMLVERTPVRMDLSHVSSIDVIYIVVTSHVLGVFMMRES